MAWWYIIIIIIVCSTIIDARACCFFFDRTKCCEPQLMWALASYPPGDAVEAILYNVTGWVTRNARLRVKHVLQTRAFTQTEKLRESSYVVRDSSYSNAWRKSSNKNSSLFYPIGPPATRLGGPSLKLTQRISCYQVIIFRRASVFQKPNGRYPHKSSPIRIPSSYHRAMCCAEGKHREETRTRQYCVLIIVLKEATDLNVTVEMCNLCVNCAALLWPTEYAMKRFVECQVWKLYRHQDA